MAYFVADKLKLNGFKKVVLPTPKDLLSRIGKVSVSERCSEESIPMSMTKMDALEYIDNLDRQRMREEDYARYAEEQSKLQAQENAEE